MKLPAIYSLIFAVGLLPALAGCGNSSLPAATAGSQPADEGNPFAEPPKTTKPAETRLAETRPVPTAANAAPPPRSSRLPKAAGKTDITFDDIKFDLDKNDEFKRSMITPKIEALEGKKVLIRGYILPSFQQTGLTQFVLVRDNMKCCFGPGAALYDCIVVEMKPGASTNFTVRPVGVEGTFAVREFLDPEGKPLAIYHLDGDSVQ